MRNRGTVIGDLVAVRDTEVEPSIDSMDWTFALITDPSLLPPPGDDGKDGRDGKDGKDGRDGFNGRDGKDGADGKNGEPGMQWAGMFSRRVTYKPGQVVGFEGSSYVCVMESVGHDPTHGRYFQPVALQGEQGQRGERGGAGARGRSVNQWDLDARVTALENSDVGSSVTMSAIFDSNTAAGEVVYISGDGHVDLAQANGMPQATAVGIATADVLAGQTGEYIPVGPVTCDTWNLTPGTVYYLDPNVAGGLTSTYPDGSGEFVIILGAAATPTQLNLEIHWMLEQA